MTVDVPTPDPIDDEPYPITASLYEADNTTKVLDFATDVVGSRKFQVALNIADSGQLEVPVLTSDDTTTTVNSEATALQRGRIVRYAVDGTDYSAQVIRPREQTSIDSQGNEDAQRRSVATKGLLSEWRQAVLPPAPGTEDFNIDTRHFGWMSKENDISGLGAPTFLRPMFSDLGDYSAPWVDAFTFLFDASTDRYFWFDDTVSSGLSVAGHFGFKDQGTIWLDSAPMGQGATPPESSWPKTRHGGAKLSAATHRWAFDIQGLPANTQPLFGAVIYEVVDASNGAIDGTTIRFRTGFSTGTTVYPQWKSSATPGGCTVTQMIQSVLAQVQDEQDLLADWTIDDPNGDGTVDSNGNAFDLIADAPFSIGMKLDDWLVALTAAHCDLKVSVTGKTLYVYRWRERGTFHTTPTSAPTFSGEFFGAVSGRIPNIVELKHQERDQ
jgi:hypothetical protein